MAGAIMRYKGYKYEITFCDPKQDWREKSGLFLVSAVNVYGYCPTYAEAVTKARDLIDKFVESVPQTKAQWLEAMTACMVSEGYEQCHLDEVMAWDLLQKAARHLPAEKKEG